MAKYQEGDTVRLKSGGPMMTVVEIQQNGHVFVQWFDSGELKSASLNPNTLKTATPVT